MIISWLRFLKSMGFILISCAIVVALLFTIWEFVIGPTSANAFINKYLLNPQFQGEPEITVEMVGALITILQKTILWEFIVIIGISAVWLGAANFIPVNKPGEASNWVWAWYMIFLFGAALSALVPIYQLQINGDELLRSERVIPIILILIFLYTIIFYFIGSLLATPRHMITSVPLATRIIWK